MRALILSCPLVQHSWKRHIIPGALKLGWDVVSFGEEKNITTYDIYKMAVTHEVDVFIWPRFGVNVFGDVKELYFSLRRAGIVSIAIHQDLYWGRPERHGFWKDDWWRADYVFTSDGDPRRPWKERDINHFWFPPPIPDAFVGLGDYRLEYDYDLVFVGSVHQCHMGRGKLLRWAEKRYGKRFGRFGASSLGEVWGQDLADLYRSAKVVLGDSVPVVGTWSDRVPNTLGRGGILVHPDNFGLRGVHGEHIHLYNRGDMVALGRLIDDLISRPTGLREAERVATIEHIKQGHTWSERLKTIAATATET